MPHVRGPSPPVAVFALSEQRTLIGGRLGCVSTVPQDLGMVDLAALCVR